MATNDIDARVQELVARAHPFLSRPITVTRGDDLPEIDAKLAYLVAQSRAWLAELSEEPDPHQVLRVSHLLSDAHTLRWDVRQWHVKDRQRRFEMLDEGLVEMRRETDPDVLLQRIPEAVIEHCGFDRVLVSRVEGDTWRPWRSHARSVRPEEARFADWLRRAPEIRLDRRIREGESVGQRQAVIVFPDDEDGRVDRPFAQARPSRPGSRQSGSYVAVPLAPSDDVVGLIHADYADRDVTPLDREIITQFARSFDYVYERAVLLWRMEHERVRIAEALRNVSLALEEVESTEMALRRRADVAPRRTDAGLALADRSAATRELASVLTPRELEVLSHMATGATNDRIAGELSISRDTVKSHVTHVLRKLGAENRAEAIAHYIRLTLGSL
ncbi:GAF domain-containing protein [Janibacter sp. YIM B02568]|uniref:LuxR C-terminal-related transcriptional regulator n=1 Tax=Janibacter endophyticus TaxID=2806261 RepID=UPI00194FFC9B|nr:LuxR C-terminal-related transcriptional regulator [Janibacter endophyticus]MBM6545416.1 GAF domain-containing protein [Janibacter endophyticus]